MGCEEVFAPPPNDPLGKLDEIGPKSQKLTAHIFIDATLSMEGFVIPEPTTNYIQTLKNLESPITTLFDVLYSEDEKSVTLNQGFRGHPSVGAAVLAKTLRLGEEGPWRDFYERIKIDAGAGAGAKIFLFGSIFGGTGAAE